jgi:nicotinamide-nucleotide adenylyltransferase
VPHLVSQTPKFEVVFSNEPVTSRLFKEAGFRVEPIPLYDREAYSSTEIRERVVNGDSWDKLVPTSVAGYIKSISGEGRLRELTLSDDPRHHQREGHHQF